MLVVQQGNKQLRINETDKDVYLALGYNIINEEGKVIELGNAVSTSAIKAENTSLKAKLAEYAENAEKLDQLEALQTENADLKAQLEAANKGKTK